MQGLYDGDVLRDYCQETGIELLVLFGSYADGAAGSESDVDLAVQPERGITADKLQFIFDFEEIFAPHSVDLVVLTPLTSPLLLHEIFFRGMPLYESIPGAFRKGRLRAWKLYQDTAPLRRRQKAALERFVERSGHVS